MNTQRPLPRRTAAADTLRCARAFTRLIVDRRIRMPRGNVGRCLHFADGTSAPVYRETTLTGATPTDPCVLVVAFRLRFLRGFGHTLFRWESLLNTPLFVGYPGYVSKLWLAHDQHHTYRGIYQWDGPAAAERYARSLWRVLAIGSVPGTIRYRVLPGLQRDQVLADPSLLAGALPDDPEQWWRLVDTT